jgi:uncharacterized protein
MVTGESDSFSPSVAELLGVYVYRLIDPRNGETFYVGKGTGNRVFHHVLDARRLLHDRASKNDDAVSLKLDRIRDITAAGFAVSHVIHRHGLSDDAALEVEAALIDAYPGLANLQSGHGSGARGAMTTAEIEAQYALPVLGSCEDLALVLINVNAIGADRGKERVYDQVRFAWKIDVRRARRADFVLAVQRGVVIGAFAATEWKPATVENFPEFGVDIPKRWGFVGDPAEPEMWDRLVGNYGKRIVETAMRHVQYPVRYWRV